VEQHGQTEQKPAFDPAALEIAVPAWKEVG
jgi:hypothetical protein